MVNGDDVVFGTTSGQGVHCTHTSIGQMLCTIFWFNRKSNRSIVTIPFSSLKVFGPFFLTIIFVNESSMFRNDFFSWSSLDDSPADNVAYKFLFERLCWRIRNWIRNWSKVDRILNSVFFSWIRYNPNSMRRSRSGYVIWLLKGQSTSLTTISSRMLSLLIQGTGDVSDCRLHRICHQTLSSSVLFRFCQWIRTVLLQGMFRHNTSTHQKGAERAHEGRWTEDISIKRELAELGRLGATSLCRVPCLGQSQIVGAVFILFVLKRTNRD